MFVVRMENIESVHDTLGEALVCAVRLTIREGHTVEVCVAGSYLCTVEHGVFRSDGDEIDVDDIIRRSQEILTGSADN